jgi:CubicO group peptidase (beta-lactamase class C family)
MLSHPAGPGTLGLSVAIDGTAVMERGYGPGISENTVYPIGSLSKQFTAAAILLLIERQAVVAYSGAPASLDTPIQHLFEGVDHWSLPGFPNTLRRLLNMTSRITSYTEVNIGLDPRMSIGAAALLARVKQLPLRPYGGYHYSNTNYFMLAHVIEGLARGPQNTLGNYRTFIQQQIFQRAGMTRSGFLATGLPAGSAPPLFRIPPTLNQVDWPKGAGEMYSTAADVRRWNTALMNGQLIANASLSTMLQPAAPMGDGGAYGMGWVVRQFPDAIEYTHMGAIAGYSSFNLFARRISTGRKVSVTMLASGDGVPLEHVARQIAAAL